MDCVHDLETNETTFYDYYVDGLRKRKDNTYFIWLDGNMVYEFTGTDSNTYTYGHRLLYSDDYKYVLNAHGDVVSRLDSIGDELKRYKYDAFGNELNPSETDTNPFRYCAEYFDVETGQIYLRARYYQPIVGRFTQRDTHWNTANMIYGDEVKTKEYKDYLGLNTYTVKLIDYAAVRQSGNLYGYCLNNPIYFFDPSGEIVIADDAIIVVVFAIGTIATTTFAWLNSSDGKNAISNGATAFYEGIQIAGNLMQQPIANITNSAEYAEHTKNKTPSNWDKHSKKRAGAPEKKEKKSSWNDRSNKSKNKKTSNNTNQVNNRNKGRKK